MIFHITNSKNWNEAKKLGVYEGDTLKSEGFIHCSTIDQVAEVANRIFKGQTQLVLFYINVNLLDQKLVYENLEGGNELYPHIYGPLRVQAIEKVIDFNPQDNGVFIAPSLPYK